MAETSLSLYVFLGEHKLSVKTNVYVQRKERKG